MRRMIVRGEWAARVFIAVCFIFMVSCLPVSADSQTRTPAKLALAVDPEWEKWEDLWTGDIIYMGFGSDRYCDIEKAEILKGKDKIKMETYMNSDKTRHIVSMELLEAGEVSLKVTYRNCRYDTDSGRNVPSGDSRQETLGFFIRKRPAEVKVTYPKTIKLGDCIMNWYYENLPYQSNPYLEISRREADRYFGRIHSGSGGQLTTGVRDKYGAPWHIFDENGEWVEGYAVNPGKVTLKCYLGQENRKNEKPYATHTVVIEEPVITSTEKTVCKIGDTLNFEARLTNTAYQDFDVEEREKYLKYWNLPENRDERPSDYYSKENERYIYYIPKLEVVSGADCCSFKGDAAVTTLSLR